MHILTTSKKNIWQTWWFQLVILIWWISQPIYADFRTTFLYYTPCNVIREISHLSYIFAFFFYNRHTYLFTISYIHIKNNLFLVFIVNKLIVTNTLVWYVECLATHIPVEIVRLCKVNICKIVYPWLKSKMLLLIIISILTL